MKEKPARAVVIVRFNGNYYLQADRNGIVVGHESTQEALDSFERTYDEAHDRSFERSMSACVHFLFFSPRVVQIKDISKMVPAVVRDEEGHLQLSRLYTAAGTMFGIPLYREKAQPVYDKAKAPRLVKEVV